MTEHTAQSGGQSNAIGSHPPQGPVAVLTQVARTCRMDDVDVPVIKGVDVLVRHGCFTVVRFKVRGWG